MLTPPREFLTGEKLSATHMNDLVRYLRAINPIAGPGVRMRQSPNGTVFEADPKGRSAAESTKPFAVRYVEQDATAGIPYTGFEIYIPDGCVAMPSSDGVINLDATRTVNNQTKTIAGWYRMPFPDSTPTDGEKWVCTVHVKPCSAISGVDRFNDWPKTYCFAEIHKQERTQQQRDDDLSDVGDALSVTVATIDHDQSSVSSPITRNITQSVSAPIFAYYDRKTEFELFYAFDRPTAEDLALDLDRLFVRNCSFSAAGLTFAADDMTEIQTTSEAVYLKISAATSPYTATIKEYAQETRTGGTTLTVSQQVEAETTVSDIFVRLYALKNGRIVSDDRASAHNIQLYRQ